MLIQIFKCPLCGHQMTFTADRLVLIVRCVCGSRVLPRRRGWGVRIEKQNPVRYVGRN